MPLMKLIKYKGGYYFIKRGKLIIFLNKKSVDIVFIFIF